VQGCTARGLDWLADEVWGQPNQTAVVVLDEYVAELVEGARDAGLIFELLDGPPLQPPDPPIGTDRRQGLSMEISDKTVDLLLGLLRKQVEEVDNLVRYLTSISTCAEIDPDIEVWFKRWAERLDKADDPEPPCKARPLWERY
jgi:hypothetical protein